MDTKEIVQAIIVEQSQVIGDYLAIHMAQNSGVVRFNSQKVSDIEVIGNDQEAVFNKIIDSYRALFGQASAEVCLNVIKKFSSNTPR